MSETATPRPPAGRYGRVPDARRRAAGRVVLAALLVAALAGAVWIGLRPGAQTVRWNDVGYSVRGPELVDVTFEVVKDAGVTARCTVTALSASYAEVGVVTVTIGPAESGVVRRTVPVATQELAVTGVVDRCDPVAP